MSKLDDKWERIVKKVHLILEKNKKLEEAQVLFQTQIKSLEKQISNISSFTILFKLNIKASNRFGVANIS